MPLTIPANDHGQIRVFATEMDLPEEAISKTEAGMIALFGVALNPDFVDVVKIADLGGMSLTRYIAEGYDMAPDLVDAAVVDQIKGTAVLVLSRATGGAETELHPGFGLRHITTYRPAPDMVAHDPLPAKSAQGTLEGPKTKPAKSNARMSGMVAMYALLAMFALVGLIILVAG
ncbi:hypothetical protein [Yoonia litorea]|uniref:Uncharacterized protein n=1 Tax=Yoonia litorea TaxID=1123755 RepID=A0A1I6L338_9RHOB|nr:hypothetical protein [Yoonia litorea]SFR97879.1 hypothetical protein SAMN05444714_0125 [Yoonia litorea]